MRHDTTAPPNPSATDVIDWVLAQPLAIVLLLGAIAWLARELKRERERVDKTQQANDTLTAGLTRATDVARESLETSKLLLSLMQGIDDTLRRRGPR